MLTFSDGCNGPKRKTGVAELRPFPFCGLPCLIEPFLEIETFVCTNPFQVTPETMWWVFYAHTVIVLISQFLSISSCYLTYQHKKEVSLRTIQETWLRKQSPRHNVTCTHHALTFVYQPKQTSTRSGHKNTKSAQPYEQLQADSTVYYHCLYQPVSIIYDR